MIVAGYILSVYNSLQEEAQRLTPGNTPIRRRGATQTQTQVGIIVSTDVQQLYYWNTL